MRRVRHHQSDAELTGTSYGSRYFHEPVPKYVLPEKPMPAAAAYQLIHDELNLDGNPDLNLASFVTTWMEPEADRLAAETLNRNFIDHDEYPQTEEIHLRVITMLAHLLHAPSDRQPVGTATVGSSEAIMLGLLAHKLSWRRRRQAASADATRPNVVMGADVHTCWEKFAAYFDVEARVVPMTPDRFTLTAEEARPFIDENTIAVGAVMGTTFTGQLDDVAGLAALLDELQDQHGWDIPIHVDGASGGMVLPFVAPELAWDFRVPRVRSINVSNHKFGLVYPGMGALLFRDETALPEEMVFDITYLGGSMPNCSLNFSRSATPILLQYYNFLRLGRAGYRRIMTDAVSNAERLGSRLEGTGAFEWISRGSGLPVVAVRMKTAAEGGPAREGLNAESLSADLRRRGWIIPAYHLPPDATEVGVLRMVVKENFSRDLADALLADMDDALDHHPPERADHRAARVIC
ncbi:MAG: glutamate decarboxylase [Acidimicrobiales bacterium]